MLRDRLRDALAPGQAAQDQMPGIALVLRAARGTDLGAPVPAPHIGGAIELLARGVAVPDLAGGVVDNHRRTDQPHRTGTTPTAPFGRVQASLADGLPAEQCVHVVLPRPRSRRWETLADIPPTCGPGEPRSVCSGRGLSSRTGQGTVATTLRAVVRSCCPRPGRSLRRWRSGSCSAFAG
jgi:hypothetical protein